MYLRTVVFNCEAHAIELLLWICLPRAMYCADVDALVQAKINNSDPSRTALLPLDMRIDYLTRARVWFVHYWKQAVS